MNARAVVSAASVALLAVAPCFATVFHDQTGLSQGNGRAAQDFEEGMNARDCEAADDFSVPGPEPWVVDELELIGSSSGVAATVSSVLVTIYDHANGPGAVSCSRTGSVVAFTGGNLSVRLSSPCVLAPGEYWLGVQASLSWGGGGQWFWSASPDAVGRTAVWRNPARGFPTLCSGWGTLPDCHGTSELSFLFAVMGRSPHIFSDGFESGSDSAWSSAVP